MWLIEYSRSDAVTTAGHKPSDTDSVCFLLEYWLLNFHAMRKPRGSCGEVHMDKRMCGDPRYPASNNPSWVCTELVQEHLASYACGLSWKRILPQSSCHSWCHSEQKTHHPNKPSPKLQTHEQNKWKLLFQVIQLGGLLCSNRWLEYNLRNITV